MGNGTDSSLASFLLERRLMKSIWEEEEEEDMRNLKWTTTP